MSIDTTAKDTTGSRVHTRSVESPELKIRIESTSVVAAAEPVV